MNAPILFTFDEFELTADGPELRRSGQPVKADTLVLRLLHALVRRAGELVTKQELIATVWDNRAVSENVITVAMVRLRKTLGHRAGEREFIANVHGRGYRFLLPVSTRSATRPFTPLEPSARERGALLVGRAGASRMLREALREARHGRGQLCLVTGAAGIGKTRLLEELSHDARAQGFAVAWAHCHALADAPPLWPIARLMRALDAQTGGTGALCVLDRPEHAPALGALPEFGQLVKFRLRSVELGWHFRRAAALHQLQREDRAGARDALRVLAGEADDSVITSSQLLAWHDLICVLGDREFDRGAVRSALAAAHDDPPSVWSLKLAIAARAGLHEEARAGLGQLLPEALRALPYDRDYLGTLGHLTRVVVALELRDYAEVLLTLLAPHTGSYAADLTLYCDASIAQHTAALAGLLGRDL